MSVSPSKLSLDRVAVHTITCKPMPLEQLCAALKDRGFGAISVWREAIEEAGGTRTAKAIIKDAGLEATALVRGGFLPSPDATERQSAIDENKRIIDEAAAINARMAVIVPGAHPEVDLSDARRMVTDGLGALTHHAQSAGVGLALEPLHPMYAGDRSCVNTLKQAREICNQLQSPAVGVAIDVYHTWWDDQLETEIEALGKQNQIMAFHVCDWLPDTQNRLTDRGLMGDGCIDIPRIRALVEQAGFSDTVEVEVIGERYWSLDQNEYLDRIAERCATTT